jgi:hypothetical protein
MAGSYWRPYCALFDWQLQQNLDQIPQTLREARRHCAQRSQARRRLDANGTSAVGQKISDAATPVADPAALAVRSQNIPIPFSPIMTAAKSGLEKSKQDSTKLLDESWPTLTGAFEKLAIGKQQLPEASFRAEKPPANSKETIPTSSVYTEEPVGQSTKAAEIELAEKKSNQGKKSNDIISFKDWSLDYQLEPDEIIRQLAKVRFRYCWHFPLLNCCNLLNMSLEFSSKFTST